MARMPRPAPRHEDQDPALTAERRAAIREALLSLSAEQREALVLVEWLGFSPADAARILATSAESVRARLHRARSSLQRRFGGSDV